ncbi:Uncharacterised protein [Mycobacteroides abscessus subsp. bolletii]|uniref:hypothetical protein n=1 Tax=Mycobacteroides abscessus TaxID=36809 RepID=UPI0009A6CA5B|nr:hypothetical protein [Mycobacteroides abscessus]SKS14181.1 Uncharacterised protein [Mycobacteroides abscessus subsp. bolletii]SKS29336.1 Uncharacterised protein [Mycobacteroides abscessus subsp. bolletii]
MPEVSEHVITAAVWEYLTPAGVWRRAFFGDLVTLTDEEVERGLAVGALGVELPAESTDDDSDVVEADASDEGDTDSGDGGDGDPGSTAGDSGNPSQATGTEVDAPRKKPLKAATKAVLVDWLMANGTYGRDELEAQEKDDLWALIEATD